MSQSFAAALLLVAGCDYAHWHPETVHTRGALSRDCKADAHVTEKFEHGHFTIYEFGVADCKPCDAARPALDRLATRGVSIRFVDVNDCVGSLEQANLGEYPVFEVIGPSGAVLRRVTNLDDPRLLSPDPDVPTTSSL
jgi:hypothetical protein